MHIINFTLNKMKLSYKLHITGELIIQTGLHIGGSEVDLDIGGLDNEVAKVKDMDNDELVPYIPGSSLKGKMKSLVDKFVSSLPDNDRKKIVFNILFGDKKQGRAIFRDSYLKKGTTFHLEDKAENWIIKATGEAKPRHMERVAKGAIFILDIIIDIYRNEKDNVSEQELLNLLKSGLNLLTYDYLGGSGSRGYGQIKFNHLKVGKISFDLQNGTVSIPQNYTDFTLTINET